MPDFLIGILKQGLRQLGEDPARHPCDAYLAYLDLLEKWNSAYSLTGIKQKDKMLTHHILDSLSVLPLLKGSGYIGQEPRCREAQGSARAMLDIGTGAGLPGLILALARPEHQWVLLDSNKKKIRFVQQAVLELGLENVEPVCVRGEDYRPDKPISVAISRALTSLLACQKLVFPILQADGILLAMKGRKPVQELAELDTAGSSYVLHKLNVPGIEAQRHVVEIFAVRTPSR